MNELWMMKLDDVTQEYEKCLQKEMTDFLRQRTQADRDIMDEFCMID